jgi:hypothetical protein
MRFRFAQKATVRHQDAIRRRASESAPQQTIPSFDHFVGGGKQLVWKSQTRALSRAGLAPRRILSILQ